MCIRDRDRGMCADWSIHDKGDGNPHVHLLLTMRPFNPDHSWGKKEVKDWDFLRDKNGNIVIDESHPNWWQDKKNPDRHGIRIPVSVSYTHLDVYKRQAVFDTFPVFLRILAFYIDNQPDKHLSLIHIYIIADFKCHQLCRHSGSYVGTKDNRNCLRKTHKSRTDKTDNHNCRR